MKINPFAAFLLIAANFATPPAPAAAPTDVPNIIAKIQAEAEKLGVPSDLATAVGFVETGFDPSRIGAAGEVGLMQVMPTTATGMGFQGANADLADIDTNIRYDVRYLAEAWTLADHDVCLTLAKYNAGHATRSMSTMTSAYCQRALVHLASIRSPLGAGIRISLVEASTSATLAGPLIPIETGPHRSVNFWAREKARIRAVDAQLEARWSRISARNGRVAGRRSLFGNRFADDSVDR